MLMATALVGPPIRPDPDDDTDPAPNNCAAVDSSANRAAATGTMP